LRERRKASFEVPDSGLVGCGIVSTGKGDCLLWNIAYIFRIEQWKNNGILFEKCGVLC